MRSEKLDEKKIIGVQLNSELYQALQDLAAEYGGNISTTIRMILLDYLKRYKGFKNKKGSN